MSYNVINSFNAGELSPLLEGRSDLEFYYRGLATLTNGFVLPQGGIEGRPGLEFMGVASRFPAGTRNKKVRLVAFEQSTTQAYILEFGNLYMRVWKSGADGQVFGSTTNISAVVISGTDPIELTATAHGHTDDEIIQVAGTGGLTPSLNGEYVAEVVDANTLRLTYVLSNEYSGSWNSAGTVASPYELATSFTEDNLADLQFRQSADTMYITSLSHTIQPRKLTRTADDAWALEAVTFTNGPFIARVPTNVTITPSGTGSPVDIADYYKTGDDSQGLARGVTWLTQTFQASDSYSMSGVKLKLWRVGLPGTVTVSIRATAAGEPTGGNLASGTMDGDILSATSPGSWQEITFTSPIVLTSGTTYAIVVRATSGDLSNSVYWREDASSPSYASGSIGGSVDSGSTWTMYASSDFMFEAVEEDGNTRTITLTASAPVFDSDHVGALFKLLLPMSPSHISGNASSADTSDACYIQDSIRLVTMGTWTGEIQLERSDDGGDTWEPVGPVLSSTSDGTNYDEVFDEPERTKDITYHLNIMVLSAGAIDYNIASGDPMKFGVVEITAVAGSTSATARVIRVLGNADATSPYPTLKATTKQVDPGLTHTTAITNRAGLEAMASNLAGNYYLTADIDLSVGGDWTPIGFGVNSGEYFEGSFDGNGYTISGLHTGTGTDQLVGLFGVTNNGAKIANVTLTDVDIIGTRWVGSLIGYMSDTDIWNCHASGIVKAGGTLAHRIGGLIGTVVDVVGKDCLVYDCSTAITVDAKNHHTSAGYADVGGLVGLTDTDFAAYNCTSTGNVTAGSSGTTGGECTGGLVGNTIAGTFVDCSATGVVIGDDYVGGFIGFCNTTGDFTRCSATGNVTANDPAGVAGGFCGRAGNTFTDCYAWGNVIGGSTSGEAGGFCGVAINTYTRCYSIGTTAADTDGGFSASGAGTMTDCYWDTEASGDATSSGNVPTGRTTSSMQTKDDYASTWDFVNVWLMSDGEAATKWWSEGCWSDYRGWPGTMAFFQQRTFWGGTSFQPQTNWGSRVNDFEDLMEGANDDEAFGRTIDSDHVNETKWLVAHNALLIGTSDGEWKLSGGGTNEPVTPSNVQILPQSNRGSADVPAVLLNDAILFVRRGGTEIRELIYSLDQNTYISPNRTIRSEHIGALGISEIVRQKDPETILWCVLDNGNLATLTYDRVEEVFAWAQHSTEGTFESIARIPGTDGDEIWVSVLRNVLDTSMRFIERFKSRTFTAIADAFFVDCAETITGTNLTYAKSQWQKLSPSGTPTSVGVAVLGDGEVIYDGTEVASAVDQSTYRVTFPGGTTPDKVQVGHPFTTTIKTMPLAAPRAALQGRKKHISQVTGKFIKTANGKVDGNNGTQNLGLTYATTVTTKKIPVLNRHDRDGQVIITQPDPLPLTLLMLGIEYEAH